MKTRKNLMVLVLLSLFLSVGVADGEVSKKENPVILKLYEKLQKADSDIDESVLDDLKTMLNNDEKIGVDELIDTFGDDLINIDFISDISKDSQISPYLKYANLDDNSINDLLKETKATLEEAERYHRSAEENYKEAEALNELTDTINRTLKALGGD